MSRKSNRLKARLRNSDERLAKQQREFNHAASNARAEIRRLSQDVNLLRKFDAFMALVEKVPWHAGQTYQLVVQFDPRRMEYARRHNKKGQIIDLSSEADELAYSMSRDVYYKVRNALLQLMSGRDIPAGGISAGP